MHIDALIASVEPELTALRADLSRLQAALATGKAFYATAAKSIDAWAAAHADIAKALEEKRTPNLTLLAARAQELHALIEDLKSANQKKSTP